MGQSQSKKITADAGSTSLSNASSSAAASQTMLLPRRIAILGDKGVGKNCLVTCLTEQRFEVHPYYDNMDAVRHVKYLLNDADNTVFYIRVINNMDYVSRVMDPSPLKGCDAYIICYSLTDQKSFDNVKDYLKEVRRKINSPEVNTPIILMETKSDLSHRRVVNKDTAKEFAANNNIIFIETSSKERKNINETFRKIDSDLKRNEELAIESSNPGFLNYRKNIIKRLDAYIRRIEQYNGDYAKGFLFFRETRALNREANYRLARELKSQLTNTTSFKEVQDVIKDENIHALRIQNSNDIFGKLRKDDRGINSEELNKILYDARNQLVPNERTRLIKKQ